MSTHRPPGPVSSTTHATTRTTTERLCCCSKTSRDMNRWRVPQRDMNRLRKHSGVRFRNARRRSLNPVRHKSWPTHMQASDLQTRPLQLCKESRESGTHHSLPLDHSVAGSGPQHPNREIRHAFRHAIRLLRASWPGPSKVASTGTCMLVALQSMQPSLLRSSPCHTTL